MAAGGWTGRASPCGALILVSLCICLAGAHAASSPVPHPLRAQGLAFAGGLLPAFRPLLPTRGRCAAGPRRPPLGPAMKASGGPEETEEELRLRQEYLDLLSGTGRDMGMKKLKAPKGSMASLSAPRAATPPPDAKPPAGKSGAAPPLQRPTPPETRTMAELMGDAPLPKPLAGPPVARPPAPPLVKPSYSASAFSDDVLVVGLMRGDTVPAAAWAGLADADGAAVSLAQFAGRQLLLVPEPAHHTGAPTDSWVRLLNDLRDTLGSKRSDVAILAVSPEPAEVHAKLRGKQGYKFPLASDPQRKLLTALKLWIPEAAQAGVQIDRQTFLINPDTGKIEHVWRKVEITGHAMAVRDFLDAQLTRENTPPPPP